jgi:hypothetical protein
MGQLSQHFCAANPDEVDYESTIINLYIKSSDHQQISAYCCE